MTAPDELAEAERYLRESAAISSWHVVAGVHSEALALVLAEYDRRGTELARLGAVCADMNRIRNEAAAASAALAGTTTPTAELRTLRDLRSAVDAFIATKWPQKYSEYTVLRAAADSARVEIDLFASTPTTEGPS